MLDHIHKKHCSPPKSFLRLPTSFFFIHHFTIRAQCFPYVLRLCIALQFYNPLRSRLYVLRLSIALRRLVEMRRSGQAAIFYKLVSVAMVIFLLDQADILLEYAQTTLLSYDAIGS